MPDQALFAYKVQLPDGSEAVRTGGADRAPTYGELADYAANQGERFLGHVPMSPAPLPPPPDTAPAPAPAPSGGLGTAEAATLPAAGAAPSQPATPQTWGAAARQTFLPGRSFLSETPSMVAGTLGGMGGTALGAMTGPLAPVAIPVLATAGSALASGGMEYLQAKAEQAPGATSPPSEAGTPFERAERAAVRGGAGELVTQPVRWIAKGVQRVAGPFFRATEDVAPALEQAVPAGVKGVPQAGGGFAPAAELLGDPAKLAAADLTPKGQDTLFRMWWQQNAPKGAGNVVNAWDALAQTPGAQQALAGGQHEAVSTLVDSLRPGLEPIMSGATGGQVIKAGLLPTAVRYAGFPHLATALGGATLLGERYAPRLVLNPTAGPLLAQLPAVGRTVAAPADFLLRAGGQYVGNQAFP